MDRRCKAIELVVYSSPSLLPKGLQFSLSINICHAVFGDSTKLTTNNTIQNGDISITIKVVKMIAIIFTGMDAFLKELSFILLSSFSLPPHKPHNTKIVKLFFTFWQS